MYVKKQKHKIPFCHETLGVYKGQATCTRPPSAARGHHVFIEFCTPEVEEEHEEVEGNPNGVLYAVAVKTDVEIIVGNLLRQISAACSLCLRWSGTILCEVRLQASISRSAKKKLESLCTLQHSWEKLRIGTKIVRLWSNNSACTPQTETLQQSALFAGISHFAMNIIVAQALPNHQSKFRQIQKFQQSAKISGHTVSFERANAMSITATFRMI